MIRINKPRKSIKPIREEPPLSRMSRVNEIYNALMVIRDKHNKEWDARTFDKSHQVIIRNPEAL